MLKIFFDYKNIEIYEIENIINLVNQGKNLQDFFSHILHG